MDTPEASGKPDLFSKIGPLPAWAWGAIIVVGYLAYRRVVAARTPVAVTDPGNLVTSASTDPSGMDVSGGGGGGGSVGPESSGYNYGDVLAGNYTGTTSGAVFATNQQWAVYAINNLPKLGYSAGEVASAITFYLSGLPLTDAQRGIVSDAISHYGSPPLPLPLSAIGDANTPATSPTVLVPRQQDAANAVAPSITVANPAAGAQISPGVFVPPTMQSYAGSFTDQLAAILNSHISTDPHGLWSDYYLGSNVYHIDTAWSQEHSADLSLALNPYANATYRQQAIARL